MKNKILSIVITSLLFLTAFSSFVFAAPILTSSISATPATVNSGDTITVTMTVYNTGDETANNVQPSALTIGGTGTATIASGPTPSTQDIPAAANRTFSWTYTAGSVGTVNFIGNAGETSGPPSGRVSSTSNSSNNVAIQAGTPGADCTHSFSVNCDSYENIDFDLISCISANSNHYQSHTNPSHGSVSVISNRMIRYTPVSGYSGPDSFTFTAGGKTVQVNVTVTCNSPPIPDCTYYVDYNCATGDIIVGGTTYNYINVNDAARTCYPTANYKGSMFLVNPNPGTAVFAGQGNQIDYSLSDCSGYCGQTDTLTFLADKVGAGGDIPDPITIKVVIGIICSNGNDEPIANADSAEVCKDSCVTIDVLSNDINKGASPQINFIGTPTGGAAELSNGKIKYCAPEIPGTYFFDYTFTDGEVTSNTATVTVVVNDCIIEEEKKLLPPSILYPGIDIVQLTVPSSGANVILGGKVVSPLEIVPGTQSLSVQVKNKGFLTQIDAGVRLEGLPQGVAFTLEPSTQKIKGHNTGTYTMTLTVPPTTPQGTYPIKAVSYSRRGITDRVEFNLIVD